MYLLVYVDDIILAGPSDDVNEVKKLLVEQFNVTDLVGCPHFLSVRTERPPSSILLSQKPVTEKVTRRAGMTSVKPV